MKDLLIEEENDIDIEEGIDLEEDILEQELSLNYPLNRLCLDCVEECKQFSHVEILKCQHFNQSKMKVSVNK